MMRLAARSANSSVRRSPASCFSGRAVDYLSAPADSTLTVEERPTGGLGVPRVQNVMDDVSYHRKTRENVVMLTAYPDPQDPD